MNIVLVTSEAAPYAKTGGLADVCGALPKVLAGKGHKVSVIMPYYPQVMKSLTAKTKVKQKLLEVPFGTWTEWGQIREIQENENLSFYFIEHNVFFDRPFLYDYYGTEYGDNAQRFIFFSRAAMQAIISLGINPDILHTNDWPTALCNVYLKSHIYTPYENFKATRSVITIHNIGYQGVFNKDNLNLTGLGWNFFNHTCLEYHDQLNFLQAGILTADMVNTVSPTYAQEIMSADYGFTLEGALNHVNYRRRLRGILNGIDIDEWNPKTDKNIPKNYTIKNLSGKKVCKEFLQKEFELPRRDDVPLLGIVSRLASQKGIDIFAHSIEDLLFHDDLQVVVLGTGEASVEGHLSYLNKKYPAKFSTYIGFSNRLSHLVEAGSDFFIMPSRYEPCGLNQMYSMRYGTIPIVRGTGGLDDTVINYHYDNIEKATGFKFYLLSNDSIRNTIRWALSIYKSDKTAIDKIIKNGMTSDFSWNKTANEYEKMYKDALELS